MDEQLSDVELIEKIKSECSSEAFEILQNRHSGLFVNIVQRFSPILTRISGVCYQDVLESKTDLLYRAVLDYDASKGAKFNTWFGNKVVFFCKNTLNASNKFPIHGTVNPEDMENFIDENISFIEPEDFSEEAKMVFDILDKHSDPRLSRIFYLRFYLSKPWNSFNNIAKEIGVSVQGVINLYNKGKEYLSHRNALKQWIK